MQTVTLRDEDFKILHNTLCDLRGLVERMERSMIKVDDVQRIVEGFESGLRDAYAQDNDQFESKMDYYAEFKSDNGLETIWSIYELPIHGFLSEHPFKGALQVAYKQYWGDQPVFEEIEGGTWADLYRAADRCIRRSGDDHHIFIEHFVANPQQPDQLLLTTGS
jgi:hypothetical protein